MTKKIIALMLVVFVFSMFSIGCSGIPNNEDDKAIWGSAKFGADKWNK